MMNSTVKNSSVYTEFNESDDFLCFGDEIRVHIDRIDVQIDTFLKNHECIPDTKELLRSMHSIKGTAGFWNVPAIQEAAHRAETYLVESANKEGGWSVATASMVVNACHELRHLLVVPLPFIESDTLTVLAADQVPMRNQEIATHWNLILQGMDGSDDLDGLNSLLEKMPDCVQVVEMKALGDDHRCWTLLSTLQPDEMLAIVRMHLSQTTHVTLEPVGTTSIGVASGRVKGLAKTVRVQVESLSALKNFSGQLAELKEGSPRSITAALILQMNHVLDNIRLVTVSEAMSRYEPMVQTLAQRLNKKIEWRLNGGEILVDRRLMERVNEPLMHLVRNSCDHGIEAETVRLANGKLPCGSIALHVFRNEFGLHFHLTDDGAGLSRQALLERAHLNGVVLPKDVVADGDIWALIFEPGFSTANEVTDISGRGVGLDVVRQTILDLGGSVKLESNDGGGLTFEINVPEPFGW